MVGRRGMLAALAATLAALAAGSPLGSVASAVRPMMQAVRRPPQVTATENGLRFRLSEAGPDEAIAAVTLPHATPASPLTDAEVERLLSRLSPLTPAPEDEREWAIREKSLPPPRAGATVRTPFPPPTRPETAAPSAEQGALRVLRHAPEGAVPIAPHLSVTFSQPMVAVTAHEDLARARPPVRLDPEPPGRWRWVGTRTLLFEPELRFPMATTYTVEVPAGTPSATGGALASAERWTFTTPPPSLVDSWPRDVPVRRRPALVAVFDQKVDPTAVLATLHVEASGRRWPVRLATAEEIAREPEVARRATAAPPGRTLTFVPDGDLPANAAVRVVVGPGTPSAEGPHRTEKEQSWGFRTFGPMRVISHQCGWGGPCTPRMPWNVQFSNPIDDEAFREDMVRVTPELPAKRVSVHGNTLVVAGRPKGRTTYRVTLDAALPDTFGQTLGETAPLTFTVGPADPALWAPGGDFVVLDPAGRGRFSVFSVNQAALRVRVHAVGPEDWESYRRFRQGRAQARAVPPLPGRPVFARTVSVAGPPDELTETAIDLGPALRGGLGQLVIAVEPARREETSTPTGTSIVVRPLSAIVAWVQATRIGLHAMVDDGELIAWASDLGDGRPLSGVQVRIGSTGAEASTGADGLARLPLGPKSGGLLVARAGGDVALLPDSSAWWSQNEGSWVAVHRGAIHRYFVFDDRHLYRPGEQVKAKGYIRSVGLDEGGDVEAWRAERGRSLGWKLRDSQGNEIAKGVAEVNVFGAFDLTLALPPTMNLGTAQLEVRARDAAGGEIGGPAHVHGFEVQEFRRPEFEVGVEVGPGPHFVGTHTIATVKASYFAGGALTGSEVQWRAMATPGSFRPPNRDDFIFGTWSPWWRSWSPEHQGGRTEDFAGRTDAAGRHRLRIDLDGVRPPRPSNLRVEATVHDVNRQAWTGGADLLVHPASIYVGLRLERPFVGRGEPVNLDAIVTDLDGNAVPGQPIEAVAERLEWTHRRGVWSETVAESEPCAVTSGAEAVSCTFRPREGGTWRITARVTDEGGRPNESEVRVWVAGDKAAPARDLEQQEVTLIPDKKEYRPGEVARLFVAAPFVPAEGVLSLRRSGVIRVERFRMDTATRTFEIPIEEGWTPDVHAQVDLVGRAARASEGETAPKPAAPRPAFATGTVRLGVPPLSRTLRVTAAPRENALEPGGQTSVSLVVTDAVGQPVSGAELAVVVVDEAVLSLTGYQMPDPMAAFYVDRGPGARDHELRSSVVLARAEDLAAPAEQDRLRSLGYVADSAVAGFAAQAAPPPPPAKRAQLAETLQLAEEAEPIRTRADWAALAHFAPSVVTDERGRAEVPVTVPDNLTRYRIMAVAATRGREFGKGESTLTARLPLMVRASPPRFLNFGDRFELPVVVQNQTASPMTVDVGVRTANASLTGPRGLRVSVPANDRVEVRFPAAAARAGTARFQVAAASGRFADASEHALPVWTPATTEAFATYGVVDRGAVAQPVQAPTDAIPDFGSLEVTTTSTALATLTDAVLYLVAYPFECTEQVSSRILGVAGLRDVLAAFQARGLPEPKVLAESMQRDVALLRRLQNDDGGWPFWRRGDESWPYVSIHVAHALQRGKEKGYAVPDETLARAREYLRQIERHYPSWYDVHTRRTLTAYALYVRQRMGDHDPARARALVREAGLGELRLEAIGWLLPVLSPDAGSRTAVEEIRRHLDNRAVETAATAHFTDSYGEQGAHVLLHSDRRADAVILESLIGDQPQSDLIPKLVEGLLGHRTRGRWENTQENAFVLLALDRYFNTYEKTTPDFVARLWLGDTFAGEHAFRGRTTDRQHVDVPMRVVASHASGASLVLSKEGAGRLYYRIGMQYAPRDLVLAPADHGFTVERAYEAIDDPGDVRRDADGTWRIKAGARVRVRVTMVSPSRRYHVALVDPLPAGLEPLNPELATTGRLAGEDPETVDVEGSPGLGRPGSWWWWRRVWYDHENLRDERVEAFSSLLWEGVWTYRYQARATTPGRFVVPPSKAEEMYHPETFGRGATAIVIIE